MQNDLRIQWLAEYSIWRDVKKKKKKRKIIGP